MIIACVLAAAPGYAQAQLSRLREYEIKAAFLYNFAKFVEWPGEALSKSGDTVTICALIDDSFSEALDSIKDKSVKGRRVAVRRIEALRDLESCHVLFVASSEEERLPQVMRSVEGTSVLTVGEMSRFTEHGGIINFVVDRNRVRFEINATSAARARLTLSSQLLSLATVVR